MCRLGFGGHVQVHDLKLNLITPEMSTNIAQGMLPVFLRFISHITASCISIVLVEFFSHTTCFDCKTGSTVDTT